MSTFDRRYEQIPRPELEQMQLERLQALLARLRRNVRRYREKLGDFRLQSLGDLHRLPFTTQEDMVESFPYGMFAFPLREVIRLHTTLGPNGKPLVIGHTRNDLAHWSRLVARQLAASGVTANDVILISLGGLLALTIIPMGWRLGLVVAVMALAAVFLLLPSLWTGFLSDDFLDLDPGFSAATF